MAYAVSGRNDYQQSSQGVQKYIEASIRGFHYIGTRDEVTKKELQKIADQEIDRNCDPVFLMPELFRTDDKKKIRQKFSEKFGVVIDRPLVCIMLVHNKTVAGTLFNMMKRDNLVVSLYEPIREIGENNLTQLSPFEWSEMVSISDLVITDLFHGTVFSLVHGVPFICLEHSEKGRGKIENLLKENFMEDKFLYQSDYKGNNRKLAVDLYTRGRNEMRNYKRSITKNAMLREFEKSQHFFEVLGNAIENKCTCSL